MDLEGMEREGVDWTEADYSEYRNESWGFHKDGGFFGLG
jgi:hypothetical protein